MNSTNKMNRRHATFTLGALAMACMTGTHAQSASAWPSKSVRIINPFPVGGGPDGTSRILADKLGRLWKQSVIVENRPGGNGFIAIDAFKRGATDGTDIIQLDNVHIAAYPSLFKKLPYDVEKDFKIVLPLFRTYFFVCVPNNSPYKTVADLIADAKARPGALNYGSWSVGNPVHLGSALLESLTNTKMEHVIYKETSQLYQSVANGELAFALGSSGTAGPLARAGKLRFLAVMAPQRLKGFEDVPTIAESGGPAEAFVTGWNALAVSPKTPDDVVEKIRKDVTAVLREPDIDPKYQTFGYVSYFPTQQEFQQFMQEEEKRFSSVIQRSKISL
ncbi:Bug family tripartite tricarboxylate transporter substrate binding protein [Comamonas sp. NoAH]|uniref:Bug family tripartite tricarboxylate transporter substrate binding protein n=1 Tax=Comamonas halotolerans TaxID=3041496 RepID=UPI0024E1617C|nr:tripartite tricarboxylate transporter substrate binding protein [Comamonas sp. NoAH]